MDLYPKYKSPFGYQVGDNGIDSYGVDHSEFSSRDEIEYQMARDNRENQLAQNFINMGIAEENYPQYGTNFWGDANNNYGFGSSNISSAISAHPAMNTTPIPMQPVQTLTPQAQMSMNLSGTDNGDVPRYWESAAEGKRVYDYMIQQEGNFTPPIQRPEFYQLSAIKAAPNLIQNYNKLAPQKVTDKYKHAYMNCSAAQYGQGGADVAMLASNLREWYDKKVGKNTLDSSEGDQYANRIGRFLGSKYPKGDCDELVQRYIDRRY